MIRHLAQAFFHFVLSGQFPPFLTSRTSSSCVGDKDEWSFAEQRGFAKVWP
jgi:hypothetical protein